MASTSTVPKASLLAFDPGKNIGVAYVDAQGTLLHSEIVDLGAVKRLEYPPHAEVVIGDGTGSRAIQDVFFKLGLEFKVVDERGNDPSSQRPLFQRPSPCKLDALSPPPACGRRRET